jgi:hypothetical protein
MSSTPPPSHNEPTRNGGAAADPASRPRYLVVALVAALVVGAGCWTEGCSRLAFYRGERDHTASIHKSIRDDEDRAHAEELYQRYVDVADSARSRAVPLAAATFVLGAALLALAARGLAGKSNTRSALMQVVAVQAIVVGAGWFFTRDVRDAEEEWQYSTFLSYQRESLPPDQYAEVARTIRGIRRWGPPSWLAFRTLASALILFALSRPRSREFFDATVRNEA